MIEVGGGITIGAGITLGQPGIPSLEIDFVTENSINLISETGLQFIEENN
jgi:hypothetical protein